MTGRRPAAGASPGPARTGRLHPTRIIAVAALGMLVLALWSWKDRGPRIDHSASQSTAARPRTPSPPPTRAPAASAPAPEVAPQPDPAGPDRLRAMRQAASVLQTYLAAIPAGDRKHLATFWSGGALPDANDEANLHALAGLPALRIDSRTPQSLDPDTAITGVPTAVQIPVNLRARLADGSTQSYQGWYRLRRSTHDGQWRITSAAVRPGKDQPARAATGPNR